MRLNWVREYDEYEPGAKSPAHWIEFHWTGVRINGELYEDFRACRDLSELHHRKAVRRLDPGYWEPNGIELLPPCLWRAQVKVREEWIAMEPCWDYELPSGPLGEQWTRVPRHFVYERLGAELTTIVEEFAKRKTRTEQYSRERRRIAPRQDVAAITPPMQASARPETWETSVPLRPRLIFRRDNAEPKPAPLEEVTEAQNTLRVVANRDQTHKQAALENDLAKQSSFRTTLYFVRCLFAMVLQRLWAIVPLDRESI